MDLHHLDHLNDCIHVSQCDAKVKNRTVAQVVVSYRSETTTVLSLNRLFRDASIVQQLQSVLRWVVSRSVALPHMKPPTHRMLANLFGDEADAPPILDSSAVAILPVYVASTFDNLPNATDMRSIVAQLAKENAIGRSGRTLSANTELSTTNMEAVQGLITMGVVSASLTTSGDSQLAVLPQHVEWKQSIGVHLPQSVLRFITALLPAKKSSWS